MFYIVAEANFIGKCITKTIAIQCCPKMPIKWRIILNQSWPFRWRGSLLTCLVKSSRRLSHIWRIGASTIKVNFSIQFMWLRDGQGFASIHSTLFFFVICLWVYVPNQLFDVGNHLGEFTSILCCLKEFSYASNSRQLCTRNKFRSCCSLK